MAPRLPQRFGPYTLHELIARGGMAEIYRATMPGIGGFEKTVAIKKILPHLAENDEFITMLIDEARIIVSINHANIAQVYDLGRIDDTYYIAMEYVHGVDLSSLIKEMKDKGSTVPLPHAIYIASGICAGLHIAHNKCDERGRPLHIVHRDVSPHNILISYAGDVKIIDFGVAKARGKEAHTKMGVIKGKLLYMAPEQAMAKEVDGRADLFAAGLILYRMLTGALPFEGDNEFQIYNNILSKEVTPPRVLNPGIPEELNQIVMMLLQRDPDKRYQDGYSAKVDLDRCLQNVAPGYTVNRLSRFIEEHFTQQRRGQDDTTTLESSNTNGIAPSTPSRNSVETGQLTAQDLIEDDWDELDELEDTVNLSLESPEAQQMLEKARRARPGSQPAPEPETLQDRRMFPGEAQRPTSSRNSHPGVSAQSWRSVTQQPVQNGHQKSQPFQQPGFGQPFGSPPNFPGQQQASGPMRTQMSDDNTGEFEQDEVVTGIAQRKKGTGFTLPIVGILLLVVCIGTMLAYHFMYKQRRATTAELDTPPARATQPPTSEETQAEEAVPEVVAEAPDAGRADAADPAEEKVELTVASEPPGAVVFLDDEELGETPLTREFARNAETLELRLEKEGFKPAVVSVTPEDGPPEKVALEPIEKPKPASPSRTDQSRRKKKVERPAKKEESNPYVPLLESMDSNDGEKKKKKKKARESDGEDEDIIDPFDL